jgi:hypothetical protein
MDAIWPLVVGFLLTTVLGGLLGTYLQRRSWEHQNEAQLRQGRAGQGRPGLPDQLAYQFNVMMLARLRNGTVGRRAPDPLEPTVMGPAPSRSS